MTLSLWANELGALVRESEAMGQPPRGREPLLRWVAAQCAITQRLQAVQRRHGKRLESPAEMGRPPFCEDLPRLRLAFAARPRP